MQRGHAGRGGDRVRRAGERGEGRLELLHARAVGEHRAGQHVGDRRALLVADHRPPERDGLLDRSSSRRRRYDSHSTAVRRARAARALDREADRQRGEDVVLADHRRRSPVEDRVDEGGRSGRPCATPGYGSSTTSVAPRRRGAGVCSTPSRQPVGERALGAVDPQAVEVGRDAAEVRVDLPGHAALGAQERDHEVVVARTRCRAWRSPSRPPRAPRPARSPESHSSRSTMWIAPPSTTE